MNQKQREFLIGEINRTYKRQLDELKAQRGTAPSLNNYIISAIMTGTIKFQPLAMMQAEIKARVLKMGNADILVKEENSRWRYDNNQDSLETNHYLNINAKYIFVLPPEYVEARKEYEEKEMTINNQIKMLGEYKDTLILKIQIGSDKVLDKLIEQADNLADLNLMNSRLALSEPVNQKQLSE